MEKNTLSRAALGHVAALGDLYDARTDNFCGTSIFKRQIPESALTLHDNHFSDIHLLHSDTFSEKFSKLDVSAELQVSVLAGLFTLEGSGRYLSDQKSSVRTVKSSLLYNIKTKEESVNIYHEDLKDAFAIDSIESGIATHVVVATSWGANSVLTSEFKNVDNRNVKEIEGSLSAQLKKMSLSISGKASVEFNEGDNDKGVTFDIRIFGDILPRNQDLPTTFGEALNLMKQMPSLVESSNEGRGKPLSYRLIPLSLLQDYLSFSIKADTMLKSLEDECLLRVVQTFESMSQTRQQINDFYQDAVEHTFCVAPSDMAEIVSFKENFAIEEAKFRSTLATTLTAVRSGEADASELEDLLGSYRGGDYSPMKLADQFTCWGHITAKIAFAKTLVSAGATYIGFGASLDDEITKHLDKKAFVLYYKEDGKNTDQDGWKANRQLFLQEMKKSSDNLYLALDCDVHENLWPGRLLIEVVQNGKVLTKDLLADQIETERLPLAKCTGDMQRVLTKPNKRINLVIYCTGHSCKPDVEYNWICAKCKKSIEFGFDSFCYCQCGRGPTTMFEFKCTDPAHGVAFERHDESYLLELVGRLRPFKEMNILILGETGVGKSTWINGFVNYLTYDSLQEAEDSELLTLIPSEFTVCDEDFNEITVSTGTDSNEVQNAGQSATQECKVYPFEIGDRRIRLIDTPGIGDTRGIDTDKKNFQNILRTLSYLDELHGICILLKPNNARLTVMFRFCIKELLTYLHRDASHNIMFCFTNARGTFYRPGDTMPALKNLLKENKEVEIVISAPTVYCYDSESYRFLAAIKNKKTPVKFPDDERDNFSKSWEKSIKETERMLKHISTLRPHPIQSTLSLNHAREVVIQLTVPMADITKNIHLTKAVIKKEKQLIEDSNAETLKLEDQKYLNRPSVKRTPLPYPRTVCAHPNCVTYLTEPTLGQTIAKYEKICHDNCGLGGSVQADTRGDANLLGCAAMTNGRCNVCYHDYSDHLHTYCKTEDIVEKSENPAIKALLEQNMTFAETKRALVRMKDEELLEYDSEFAEIQKASVKFACFLKHNAITPYNDAMIAYMDHLIMEEKGKVGAGASSDTLKSLETSRAAYKEQIDILSEEMGKERSVAVVVLNPADIDNLVQMLKKLKRTGKMLEDSLKAVTAAGKNAAEYQEVVIPRKAQPKRAKKWYQFW